MATAGGGTTTKRKLASIPPAGSEQDGLLHLLVVERESSRVFRLPRDGEVVVGRDESADLVLEDADVSRSHARIVIRHGEAEVVDLGSRNGTLVNGEMVVGSHLLSPNDLITICDTTLVFHSSVSAEARRTILDARQFRQRLEQELERSRLYERALSVAVIALNASGSSRPEAMAAIVRSVRVMDPIAVSGPGEVLVLLPEMDAVLARAEAKQIRSAVAPYAPQVCVGLASCPADGSDAGSLVSRARAATVDSERGPHSADDPGQTLMAGTRAILVADVVMQRIYALLERLAQSDLPVLIHGETGTGKDLAAAALHFWSRRNQAELVVVNCAAIQDNLIESELFGHEKGAFTGAVAAKPGLLEVAGGGTVFLDEVAELSASAQAKLLRVIEQKCVTRIGGVHERATDIRVVAATNRDLTAEVTADRFRRDLYFRLSGATVRLPPLRERRAEIPLLAEHFLSEACTRAGRSPIALSVGAVERLMAHPWPGNVRELQNLMELVVATDRGEVLQAEALGRHLAVEGLPCAEPAAAPGPNAAMPTAPANADGLRPLREELEELTRERIQQALEATGGNQTRAAALLDMPLRTFVSKLKQLRS